MIRYATVGSNKLEEAKAFYDAVLGAIGMSKAFDQAAGGRVYGSATGMFGVLKPHNGNEASVGNGTMLGFALDSRAEVDAMYAKAIELGATDEGAPGIRGGEGSNSYFAYFRDLEGNKLCAYTLNPPAA